MNTLYGDCNLNVWAYRQRLRIKLTEVYYIKEYARIRHKHEQIITHISKLFFDFCSWNTSRILSSAESFVRSRSMYSRLRFWSLYWVKYFFFQFWLFSIDWRLFLHQRWLSSGSEIYALKWIDLEKLLSRTLVNAQNFCDAQGFANTEKVSFCPNSPPPSLCQGET